MTHQTPKSWYGPIAMQKRRLAQVEALIDQYSKLIQESGDRAKFGQALDRALQQKQRIQSWLDIHERTREPDPLPNSVRTVLATLIY